MCGHYKHNSFSYIEIDVLSVEDEVQGMYIKNLQPTIPVDLIRETQRGTPFTNMEDEMG